MAIDLNYEEFICFLLIYASHSDIEFSKIESDQLRNKFGDDIFDKTYSLFNSMNDYQVLDTIIKRKDAFLSDNIRREDILNEVKSQLSIDHDLSNFEQEIYHFLERIL